MSVACRGPEHLSDGGASCARIVAPSWVRRCFARKTRRARRVKSRFLYLHPLVNREKEAELDALQECYTGYLKVCVEAMIAAHRFVVPRTERQAFFPRCDELTSQIVKNVRAHAVEIVSGWAASKYEATLKRGIRERARSGEIDTSLRDMLCLIGEHSIDQANSKVTEEALDQYWSLLLDEAFAGRKPTVSVRCGMRMSEMTAALETSEATRLTRWWIGFSHLKGGAPRIQLPLVPSPYLDTVEQASKGILARKTKGGRWRFEVVDQQTSHVPEVAASMPRIGVDVGLNVVAATSDGRLLGTALKPAFNRGYQRLKAVRANRQRQGLPQNSPRLDRPLGGEADPERATRSVA